MGLKEDLEATVTNYLRGDYETVKARVVPGPEQIPLGNKASLLTAATLFIDVRQSSDLTNTFRRQTAAKMMKSYFSGSVKIINRNSGYVRSFNGDGMLAIFIGDRRADNAVKAAMQIKSYVILILQPKFARYFSGNRAAVGKALGFSIGCGVDDGEIFAVKVGIGGTNDVAWIGRCTNTSAKLANSASTPREIAITGLAFKELSNSRKYSSGRSMWSSETARVIGGVRRLVRTTNFHWPV